MSDFMSALPYPNNQLLKLAVLIMFILLMVTITRSIIRIMMPVVVIGLVMVVFLGFTPQDVVRKGKQFADYGYQLIIENILPYFNGDSLMKKNEAVKPESGTPSEDKYSTEEELKKFFHEESGKRETEILREPRNEEHNLNKL